MTVTLNHRLPVRRAEANNERLALIFFDKTKNMFILLPEDVFQKITGFTKTPQSSKEAGGIFIGCYHGPHIEIVSCTSPFEKDVRTPVLFDRRDAEHGRRAITHWKKSSHTETYVGEWHTHPEDHPTPSEIDLRTWKGVVKQYQPYPLFFMIAGLRSDWFGCGDSAAIRKVELSRDVGNFQ